MASGLPCRWFSIAAMLSVFPLALLRAAELRLTELELGAMRQGWGFARTNESVAGLPLKIGGTSFANGIGTHAPSELMIQLDGHADQFRAVVGVSDGGRNEQGSVEFEVHGDGNLLGRSGVLRGGDSPKVLTTPLAGVRRLRLVVTDGGDNAHSDHAAWADAVIRYSGQKPAVAGAADELLPAALYPPADRLIPSRGDTTYHVDPVSGDDAHAGTSADRPWKTFARVNAMKFAPGDRIELRPGEYAGTLKPSGGGSAEKPVAFRFAAGRYEIGGGEVARLKLHISNGNDCPDKPKPIGILVQQARHLRFTGDRSDLVFRGSMIMFVNDRAEDIAFAGLNFDLKRPTVSEFRVLETQANGAVIQIAEGSDYVLRDEAFAWTGDEAIGMALAQQADPGGGRMWRTGAFHPFAGATAEEIGPRKVRLTYRSGNAGLVAGRQYCFRNSRRDCVGGFNTRSRKLAWRNCTFHALTGLGIVSQFSEDLTYDHVHVAPPAGSIRTCPAWADIFHFSGCRGLVSVTDCTMSGTQDDPINVHGTHLRLVGKPAPDRVLVRFMHPQTYGFAAFQPGDRVEFVSHVSLTAFATNAVRAIERQTDKDWLLTLEQPAADFAAGDVIENVSWCPDVEIRNCRVAMDATRGFLITTRGRVLVESNTFVRTTMSAIDISDDANSWFESGPVRDVTIRGNRFVQCGEPVIRIAPEVHASSAGGPVHENIRILDNFFDGGGISARGVKGLTISGNRFTAKSPPVRQASCTGVVIEKNELGMKP